MKSNVKNNPYNKIHQFQMMSIDDIFGDKDESDNEVTYVSKVSQPDLKLQSFKMNSDLNQTLKVGAAVDVF